MGIVKRILKKLSFFNEHSYNFEQRVFFGKSYSLVRESLRKRQDKDDAWWFCLAKHHDVIFDIGSNVGYMSFLALLTNYKRKIVLVDPNAKALQVAALNFLENNMGQQAYFYPAFVSDINDEEIKFFTVGTGAAGSMYASHAKSAASVNSFSYVKTVTLDYLYSFYGFKPSLVKIDVEGAETLVINGAKNLAREARCAFFVEMHKLEHLSMEENTQLLLDWCKEMDYQAWYLTTSEKLITPETVKNRGKYHLLLLPKGIEFPEYLKDIKPYTSLSSLV